MIENGHVWTSTLLERAESVERAVMHPIRRFEECPKHRFPMGWIKPQLFSRTEGTARLLPPGDHGQENAMLHIF